MAKKLLLVIIFTGIVGSIAFIMFTQQKASISQGTLSERAKEYLKSKNSRDDSALQYAAVSDDKSPSVVNNQHIEVGECFSFDLPFRMTSQRSDEPCFVSIALRSPKGTLTAYHKSATVTSLTDVPGIPMRRKSPEIYEEKKQVINGREFVLFRNTKEYYEESAFAQTKDGYIVISASLQSGETNEEDLLRLLQSVTIKEL